MDGIRSASRPVSHQGSGVSTHTLSPIKTLPPAQQHMLDGLAIVKKFSGKPSESVFRRYVQVLSSSVRFLRIPARFHSSYSFLPKLSLPLSPRRAFYFSIFGGVAFGVFVTACSFMFFDRHVSAQYPSADEQENIAPATVLSAPDISEEKSDSFDASQEDVFLEYFSEAAEEEYQVKLTEMVRGYPIEPMLPYIFEKDRTVAAFLIGIAKKESNWGKRVPVLDGQDCFNYWGYRGIRRLMGTGGHTCFNSRKDAVDTVARRIEKLVYSEQLNTPEKMILWKCGFSCQGHSRESVKKWISDVDQYFSRLEDEGY